VEAGLRLVAEAGITGQWVLDMVAHHHERHDGSGYPQGLSGNAIPLAGRMAAVVDSYDAMISGLPAWWFWLVAHVAFLIGFRNRLIVLVNWAWSYWTYQRHARIIVGGDPPAALSAAPGAAAGSGPGAPAGAFPPPGRRRGWSARR